MILTDALVISVGHWEANDACYVLELRGVTCGFLDALGCCRQSVHPLEGNAGGNEWSLQPVTSSVSRSARRGNE